MKHNSSRFLSLLLSFLCIAAEAFAQSDKPFTAKDYVDLPTLSSPAISPDGKTVAFVVPKPNYEAQGWNSQIHLCSVAERRTWQATHSMQSCTNPSWSRDGQYLIFLSSREHFDSSMKKQGGVQQLFALPIAGGEAEAWTDMESDIEEYAWSPDGKQIAVLCSDEKDEALTTLEKERGKANLRVVSSTDPKPGKALWLFDVAARAAKKIKAVDAGVTALNWSPDGKRLAYQTNYTGEYNDEQKSDVWTIDLDGKQTQITDAPGPETMPKFSPDGKRIACLVQTVPDIEFAETDLAVMDADGSRERVLTSTKDDYPLFKGNRGASAPGVALDYSVKDFLWSKDSRTLTMEVHEGMYTHLSTVDAETGRLAPFFNDPVVIAELDHAPTGRMACTVERSSTVKEIGVIENGKLNVITNFSTAIQSFPLSSPELVSVQSSDGKYNIEALLYKPIGYVKGKRYPLLLAYHGGPYGRYENKLMQYYPVHQLAQQSVMTVMPNVRGSSGYSDDFSQANRYDLGGGDFRDAMDVVDYLIREGYADSSKMAVMGGSYGGYMTNWTISQTPRFKAAISMYGIFSWHTDWSNSWQPAFEQMYFGYNYWEKPFDTNNLWVSRSPQTYVKNIVTPTLILQGTEDQYTNISNSREMYAALKELGRTVEFVTYPGAAHGLRTDPNQYIDVLDRTTAWIMKYAVGQN